MNPQLPPTPPASGDYPVSPQQAGPPPPPPGSQPGYPPMSPPGYPPVPQPYPPTNQAKTNVFAILSLVFSLIFFVPVLPLLGFIFGFVALSQIKQTHEEGKGLA